MTPKNQCFTTEHLKEHPQFLLRADFPEENCWIDAVREPMSKVDFATNPVSRHCSYEGYVDLLPTAFAGRYFKYLGLIGAGHLKPSCFISDGLWPVLIEYEGLFADLCRRVNQAMALPADAPCPIMPERARNDTMTRTEPTHFVYHDRETSTAYVVDYNMSTSVWLDSWMPKQTRW